MSEMIDWIFGGIWFYEFKWFNYVDGNLYYIDEGFCDVCFVVLVYGNLIWVYFYCYFIVVFFEVGY